MEKKSIGLLCASSLASLLPFCVHAQQQSVAENFNSATTTNQWYAINGACLTAKTYSSTVTSTNTTNTPITSIGTIPGCVTSNGSPNQYYSAVPTNGLAQSTMVGGNTGTLSSGPDVSGSGALRLTNGDTTSGTNSNNQTGAIVGMTGFPSNQGLQISFNTVTYGGNNFGGTGADGIVFFLAGANNVSGTTCPSGVVCTSPSTVTITTSGTPTTTTYYPLALGSYGGSAGYDCSQSNSPYDGMWGGYIGLGINEYGNFANKGDNGSASDTLAYNGTTPNTIGLRGAGNINATMVNALNYNGPTTTTTSSTVTTTVSGHSHPTTNTISSSITTSVYNSYQSNLGTGASAVLSLCTTPTYTMTTTPITVTTTVSSVNGGNASTSTNTTTGSTTTSNAITVIDYPVLAKLTLTTSVSGSTTTGAIYNQEAISTPTRQNAIPIAYNLTLTRDGNLSLSYSYNKGAYITVLAPTNITSSNGTLPPNFVFGFSAGSGGGSNVHEITCFKAQQISSSQSSGGSNVPQANKVTGDDQIYLASYNPTYWTGSLTATQLAVGSDGTVTLAAPSGVTATQSNGQVAALWDAGCELTGVGLTLSNSTICPTTTLTTPTTGQPTGVSSTGGSSASTGSRVVATWGGTAGTPFVWSGSAITSPLSVGDATTGSGDTIGAKRLAFLRGDRSNESNNTFRTRYSVLGDIINSSPVPVGIPSASYGTWADKLYPTATMPENASGATSYSSFASTNNSRLNVVYVGANDGMLHGFEAGTTSINSSGVETTNQTHNDGKEVMAYVPNLALQTIHSPSVTLDFAGLNYSHNTFVNATPAVGDVFYNGNWYTWLVSGIGDGGNANGVVGTTTDSTVGEIFAIDITSPSSNFSSDTTLGQAIRGDWYTSYPTFTVTTSGTTTTTTTTTVSSNISCTVSNIATPANCSQYMGSISGSPIIRRLHNGHWAAIFGNGLNSASGSAGIFILELVPTSGTGVSSYSTQLDYIDTGAAASSDPTGQHTKNGIAFATSADMDGDNITDYVYAGDALGNVWRFDLTSNSASTWASSSNSQGTPALKIFSASSSSTLAPITTAVTATIYEANGDNRVMIDFGAGEKFPLTQSSGATYANTANNPSTLTSSTLPTQQSLYGIWDVNLATWNAKPNATIQFAVPPTMPTLAEISSGLTSQTLTAVNLTNVPAGFAATQGYTGTANNVCWPGTASSNCTSGQPSPSYGWKLTLPNATEQIIYSPTTYVGMFWVNSVIPGTLDEFGCTYTPDSGNEYALDIATGGATTSVFNNTVNNSFTIQGGSQNGQACAVSGSSTCNVVGLGLSGVGTPFFLQSNATTTVGTTSTTTPVYSVGTSLAAGGGAINKFNCGNNCTTGITSGRISWLEIR